MPLKQEINVYQTDDGPCEVTLSKLGAERGMEMFAEVGGVVAGLVGELQSVSGANMTGAAAGIARAVPPKQLTKWLGELCRGAKAKHNGAFHDVDWKFLDSAFAGNIGGLYRLLVDALLFNFGNFTSAFDSTLTDRLTQTFPGLLKKKA